MLQRVLTDQSASYEAIHLEAVSLLQSRKSEWMLLEQTRGALHCITSAYMSMFCMGDY